jgi:hypothetical protein
MNSNSPPPSGAGGGGGGRTRLRSRAYTRVISDYYTAPEIEMGKGYSFPVDIWSLGVVCYILLCGFAPFEDGAYEDVCFPMPYFGHVSFEALDFIRLCLSMTPEDRPSAVQLLEHPWIRDRNAPKVLENTRVPMPSQYAEEFKRFNVKRRHSQVEFSEYGGGSSHGSRSPMVVQFVSAQHDQGGRIGNLGIGALTGIRTTSTDSMDQRAGVQGFRSSSTEGGVGPLGTLGGGLGPLLGGGNVERRLCHVVKRINGLGLDEIEEAEDESSSASRGASRHGSISMERRASDGSRKMGMGMLAEALKMSSDNLSDKQGGVGINLALNRQVSGLTSGSSAGSSGLDAGRRMSIGGGGVARKSSSGIWDDDDSNHDDDDDDDDDDQDGLDDVSPNSRHIQAQLRMDEGSLPSGGLHLPPNMPTLESDLHSGPFHRPRNATNSFSGGGLYSSSTMMDDDDDPNIMPGGGRLTSVDDRSGATSKLISGSGSGSGSSSRGGSGKKQPRGGGGGDWLTGLEDALGYGDQDINK